MQRRKPDRQSGMRNRRVLRGLRALGVIAASLCLSAMSADAGVARPSITRPTITGRPVVGSTLVAHHGRGGGRHLSFAYRWRSCRGRRCRYVGGRRSSRLHLTSAYLGAALQVLVTTHRPSGSYTLSSRLTARVRARAGDASLGGNSPASGPASGVGSVAVPTATADPSISGIAHINDTLTADTGSWNPSSATISSYQWLRCSSLESCSPIAGRNSSTYAVMPTDESDSLEIQVTATDVAGSASAVSAPTAVVPAISSGSCSGSQTCVSLPETTTPFNITFGAQDSYGFTAQMSPPTGGGPTIYSRLQLLEPGAWRTLGDKSYNDEFTSAVSPTNYYWNQSGTVEHLTAWDFRSLDKMLSEAPSTTPKEVDEEIPLSLFYCASGSWSNASTGCDPSGQPGALTDQSYDQLASFYANLVRYFRTGVLATGSGSSVSYTANSLTDSTENFAGDAGDCVTATVIDSNGFPDWVTGTVASVTGSGYHTLALTTNWSTAESYDTETGAGALTSATPAGGAAYNLASCTAPGGLSSPQDAEPWPMPPSVGNVQYFEMFNEPDLSNTNQLVTPPAVPAPSGLTLTGVNVAGGTLTAGTTYTYEIASDGVQATGVYCGNIASDNTCGGWSLPSATQSIALPTGDNAVQVSWSAPTSNEGALPQAYQIYGRTSGSQLGLAVVGRSATSGLTWTDTGAVTPTGAPSPADESRRRQRDHTRALLSDVERSGSCDEGGRPQHQAERTRRGQLERIRHAVGRHILCHQQRTEFGLCERGSRVLDPNRLHPDFVEVRHSTPERRHLPWVRDIMLRHARVVQLLEHCGLRSQGLQVHRPGVR